MTALIPKAKVQFTDQNGFPLVGGEVYMYLPNTETPKDTYEDQLGTELNTNPIILDARGEASIWGTGSYRQVVYDRNGNLIWDQLTEDSDSAQAGNYYEDTFVANGTGQFSFVPGTTTALTLSRSYGALSNIDIHFDASYQGPDQVASLNGTVLTFTSPIPVGVQNVYVKGGLTIPIAVPANGSVGDTQLAWGTVLARQVDTVAALASLNVGVYKRAFVNGFVALNDGFGGEFYYSATTPQSSANGTSIVTALGGVGCWISMSIALPQVVTNAQVLNNTGTIPSNTPLIAPLAEGMFRVNIYLCVRTPGTAGTFTPSISWTDDVGVKTFSGPPASALAGGFSQSSVFFRSIDAPFDFGVSAAGVTGSPVYDLYFTVERMS